MQHKPLITRRRNQVTYKGSPIAANQIIGGIIFCDSPEVRRNWVRMLNERHPLRFNYFVGFRDVHGAFSLQFGHNEANPRGCQRIS